MVELSKTTIPEREGESEVSGGVRKEFPQGWSPGTSKDEEGG